MIPAIADMFFRLHERLLGRRTFGVLKELERSQHWPRERIQQLQLARLRELAESAYHNTSYWRGVMDREGIRPEEIRSIEDVRRFPLLTKEQMRDNREAMASSVGGRGMQIARTSGSTNAALEFYTSADREAHISAARMRGHRWVGCAPGDKEVYFWAAPVEVSTQGRIKAIRDWLRNDGFSNALLLSEENVPLYVDRWRCWGANCLFGYVSSFTALVRLARSRGMDLSVLKEHGLRVICTTSELLGENRATIEEAFGVPACDTYGIRETGLIGHGCERQMMHTNDEQLILETIDPQTGEPTAGEGELVATMLLSHCQPVIRYRTGDIVTLSRDRCPCGRSLGTCAVSGGRILEFVVTTEGKWISAVAFIYICRKVSGVLQVQARQERLGEVRVLVAPDKGFPADGVEQVRRATRERIGGNDEIRVEVVDEIPPSPSGKQRLVIGDVARAIIDGRTESPAPVSSDRE
jgi:phenylacetate-CoA ligase